MRSLFKVFTILSSDDIYRCCMLGVSMLVGAFLEAVGIGVIFPFISLMGQPDWLSQHGNIAYLTKSFGVSSHEQLVMFCAGVLVLFYVAKNLYLAWQLRQQLNFSLTCQAYYAVQLYATYLNRPYLFHLNNNTAILLRNTYEGPSKTFTELLLSTLGLLTELITALIIWGMLILIDAFTATVTVGVLSGIVFLVLRICRKSIGKQGEVSSKNSAVMHQWVNQGLGAIKETKVLGKEAHFCAVYSEACKKYCEALRDYRFLSQAPRFLVETIVVIGMLLLVAIRVWMGGSPEGMVPLLGVLALAAFRLMPCVNRCVGYVNTIRFSKPLFDELYEDYRLIRDRRISGEDKVLLLPSKNRLSFSDAIQIDHLSFHYPEDQRNVLSDVSFVIPKGSFIGIVGASGVGKTTFVDLLLGLLKPNEGKILVDGVSINDDIKAWQANLAYVPQTIYLVDGTIRENIALGLADDEIDSGRVESVLRMAELYDFVNGLSDGVETTVGERGVKLSGGQRQRVGIARALYSNPDVLVLDEATSALDDVTEKNIADTILKLKGQITIIAVAHRVTTLVDCDFKVRFKGGNVVIES